MPFDSEAANETTTQNSANLLIITYNIASTMKYYLC
jgi:hypothetical protein